jgi:alpha-tubulin suppressor-like RCC1 family protein
MLLKALSRCLLLVSALGSLLTLQAQAQGPISAGYNTAADVPVTSNNFTATGSSINFALNFAPPVGTSLKVVENTGLTFINGEFSNLTQGQTVTIPYGGKNYDFVANYYGGSGNDLVLVWKKNRLVVAGRGSPQAGVSPATSGNITIMRDVGTAGGLLDGKTIFQVANGFDHTVVLCSDGTLFSWGEGFYGALGYGSLTSRDQPGLVDQTGVLAGKRVVSIGASGKHTLVLCSDGTLASWGENGLGQVGDGTTTKRSSPVLVSTSGALSGKTPIAISVGNHGTNIVLCSDGTLVGWGPSNSYELLQGNRTTQTSPVTLNITGSPLVGRTVASFGIGIAHVTVLCTDGTLIAWGAGIYGMLGTGSQNESQTPTLVNVGAGSALQGKTVKSLSVGDAEVLALCTDSTLVSWGLFSGDGVDTASRLLPTLVSTTTALAGKTVVKIGCHANDKNVICSDGTLAVWGGNYYGELSVGTNQNVLAPAAAITNIGTDEAFTATTADSASSNILYIVSTGGVPDISVEPIAGAPLSDGGTVALGNSEPGVPVTQSFNLSNLGSEPLTITGITKTGTHAAQFTVASFPIVVPKLSSVGITITFTPVGTGARSAALQITCNDPDEATFDLNLSGTGVALNTAPVVANYVTGNEVPVSAARFTAAGRTLNVTLGHTPVTGRNFTVVENTGLAPIYGTFTGLAQGQSVVLTFGGESYYYVADYFGGSGNNDLVLVWAANRIFTWGPSGSHLGRPNTNTSIPGAVTTVPPLNGRSILKLASGRDHAIALCSDGTLVGWGNGDYGQLGNQGSGNNYLVNQTGVLAGKRVIDIAAGQFHTLAVCSDGTLAAWGAGLDGVLGRGNTNEARQPVLVDVTGALAGKKVVAVSAGNRNSYALCSDGTAFAWGANNSGQIGDGTGTTRLSPVAIKRIGTALAGKLIKQIAAGNIYAMALCTDGTFVSWGTGQLGRGIGGDSSPTAIAINTGVGSVFAGKTIKNFSPGDAGPCVLCTDGTLAAWGFAAGDDTGTAYDTAPVLVDLATSALAGKTVTHQMASGDARFSIASDGTLAGWGNNSEYRVGDGTTIDPYLPAAVVSTQLGTNERFAWFGSAPSSVAVMAIVAGPAVGEIDVQEFTNTSLVDGNELDFGYVVLNTTRTKTITIKNVGPGPLTGLTISIDGVAADDYDIIVPPVTPVAPGESTSFVLQFLPTNFDGNSAALHISSNDTDENPFDLTLYGYGYGSPYVYLYDADENELDSDSTFTFGDAATNTPRLRTFILENGGELPLTGIDITFPTGPPGIYSLATAPPTSLAPGARATFVVAFAPGSLGTSNGTMSIASNADNNPFGLAFTGTGIDPSPPEITVIDHDDDDFELTDNTGTVALGNVVQGIGKTRTFFIRNLGTGALTGLTLSKTGANAADFTFSALETNVLAYEQTTAFTVTFLPSALVARTATIRVASNDANENPFDITLTGSGTTPEISIEVPASTPVADAGTLNFGTNVNVGAGVDHTFVIKNLGTATLYLSGIVIDGPNAADFSLLGLSDAAIGPGLSATLPITFRPRSFGPRTAAIHFVNNDSNESPYDIKLAGTAIGPEISVEQPAATVLVDGAGSINFGPAVQPAFSSRTFTLKNPGTASLTGIAPTFSGPDAANFSVTTAPLATVASKGTTTFVVRFTPSALRVFNATLRIASNDYDENPFDIPVSGEGVETLIPSFEFHPDSQIVALGAPVSFSATVDSPTAFTSQWFKGTTTFAKIAGATATTYTLPAVKLTDAAVLYRMKATNPSGNTDSSTAALTVVDRTSKTQNLASGLAKATFTVSVATTPGTPLTYLWLKDGETLPVDPDYVATGNTLVINTLVPEDAGTYTCEVTGPGGTLAGGDNVLTIFDSAPVISPNPVVMDEGIVSGDYSFFIPLDENEGTPTSFTATPLPPGLKFNTVTGEFTGKPTAKKTLPSPPYTINITAKNSIGTSTATATLFVQELTAGADGDYLGIIARGPVNDNLGGRFELKVTPTGSYTGKVFLGAKSYSFPAGSITATSGSPLVTGSLSITRAPLPALAVSFTINTNTKRITTGAVSSSGLGSSAFTGWKNVWNATTQSSDYDGYYTFSLDVPNSLSGDDDIPQGLGFGSFKVPLKGESFPIAGQTADGDKFTSSTFLGPDGDLAIFDDLPSKGSLAGILDIVPGASDTNTLAGAPTWSRPENTAATASTYRDGFGPYALVISGGQYAAPAATTIILGKPTPAVANNAGLAFFDAGLDEPSIADRRVSLIPGKSLTIAASGPTLTTLKIATDTGLISGGFTLTDAHPVTPGVKPIVRKPTFQGIIVRTAAGGQEGHGYFLLQQLPQPIFPQPAVLPMFSGGVILE